jgi:hypothetical protein
VRPSWSGAVAPAEVGSGPAALPYVRAPLILRQYLPDLPPAPPMPVHVLDRRLRGLTMNAAGPVGLDVIP